MIIDRQILDQFLDNVQVRKADNTYKTYKANLNLFFPSIIDLSIPYIISRMKLWKNSCSSSTIKLRLRSLWEFCKYANEFVEIKHMKQIQDIVKNWKTETKVVESLTTEQVKGLISNAPSNRDRVLISVLACTGMRINEALNLNVVDIKGQLIHVHDTKNNEERLINIPQNVLNLLQEYILKEEIKDALFVSNRGTRITVSAVQQMISKVGRSIGIATHFHLLRHYYISTLHNKGVPLKTIQSLSGHKSVSMCLHYCKSNNEQKQNAADMMNTIIDKE